MSLLNAMSGVVLTGHGGLEKLVWRDDLPIPEPQRGEVLIKVGAAAVNNTDVNTRTGWYSKSVRGGTAAGAVAGYNENSGAEGSWAGVPLRFPRIQGADCCGEIIAVGDEISSARIGERVLVRSMQTVLDENGRPTVWTFGSECDGGFAEYTKARSQDAIAINSSLSDVELASFPCAFSTAEGMIQKCSLGDERVLITGASGGVGSAAIQLAKRRGAHVTAVSTMEKEPQLRSLGADEVLERSAAFPSLEYDVVLDLVGGGRWTDLIDALRNGGRYVTSGAIAGPIVELDLRTLYLKDLSLLGSTHQPDRIFTDLVAYIEQKEIKPILAQTYPLRDLKKAQEAFLEKGFVGKIGIEVQS